MDWIFYLALAGGAYWWMRRRGEISKVVPGQIEFAKKVNQMLIDGFRKYGLLNTRELDPTTARHVYGAIRRYLSDRGVSRSALWDVGKTIEKYLENSGYDIQTDDGENEFRSDQMAREFNRFFALVVSDFDSRYDRYPRLD